MQIKAEKLKDILPEIKKLYAKHFKVTASHQDEFKSNVDWEGYVRLEEYGWFHVLTVRDTCKLIGYMWLLTCPSLDFKSTKMAMASKYFIDKKYWGQGLGKELLDFTDAYAKNLGIQRICGSTKITQGNAPIMMYNRAGYVPIETHWEKVL